jgi:hypothetical protein
MSLAFDLLAAVSKCSQITTPLHSLPHIWATHDYRFFSVVAPTLQAMYRQQLTIIITFPYRIPLTVPPVEYRGWWFIAWLHFVSYSILWTNAIPPGKSRSSEITWPNHILLNHHQIPVTTALIGIGISCASYHQSLTPPHIIDHCHCLHDRLISRIINCFISTSFFFIVFDFNWPWLYLHRVFARLI